MSSYGMGGDVFIPTQLSCVLAEGRQEGDYESNSNDGGSGVAALSKNDKVYHNRSQEMESFGAPRSMGGTDLPAKLFRYRTQNHRLDHMPYETEKGEMGLDQDGESREQTTYPPIGCDTRKQFILAQDCNDVHRGKLKKKVEGEDTDCSEENNQPWENILYKRQRYPDNFVPDTFLEKLVTNGKWTMDKRNETVYSTNRQQLQLYSTTITHAEWYRALQVWSSAKGRECLQHAVIVDI